MSQVADSAQNERVHFRADAQVEVTLGSEHNFYVGFSENISEGGIFIATHSLREAGTEMDLEFTVPTRLDPIRVRGVVRWVRLYNEDSDSPPGMGLQFVEIDDESAEAVRAFVQGRAPLFYD